MAQCTSDKQATAVIYYVILVDKDNGHLHLVPSKIINCVISHYCNKQVSLSF